MQAFAILQMFYIAKTIKYMLNNLLKFYQMEDFNNQTHIKLA